MHSSTENGCRRACVRSAAAAALGTVVLVTLAAGPVRAQTPDLGVDASLHGKQVLPANNVWNQDISQAPVDPNSANLIASIGSTTGLHPDFGTTWNGAPIGMDYLVVPGTQPLVGMVFQYASESDPGPYPVPLNAPIEGGAASTGDRHVLVVDRDNWKLYETFSSYPQATYWSCGSGAVFDLSANALRPAGWTSADAAGLPIFPGLVRYDEVYEQGEITHALRFTAAHTRNAYIYPARHAASSLTDVNLPPMGMRVRLKAGFDISGYPASVQVILRALKKYGMFLADNGSNWFISGAHDDRWNDSELSTLRSVPGSAFEVVQMTTTVSAPATITGGAAVAATVTLNGNAPLGGALVTLTSSNPTVASAPESILVPEGTNSAAFTITTQPTSTSVPVTISATGQGSTGTATVTVSPASVAAPVSALSLNPARTTGGLSVTGTVTLASAAPASGEVVNVTSSAAAAVVPAAVTVPAGQTSVSFTIATSPVAAATSVTITAAAGGATQSAALSLTPATLAGISVSPSSVMDTGGATGAITLSGPAAAAATVTLSSSSAVASVPASVTVPAGASTVSFPVTTQAVPTGTSVVITAQYVTTSLSAYMSVNPLLNGLYATSSLTGGSKGSGTIVLLGPAPAGGVVVKLSSSSTSLSVPTTVAIPAGASRATFSFSTKHVPSTTVVTITASLNAASQLAAVTVKPR